MTALLMSVRQLNNTISEFLDFRVEHENYDCAAIFFIHLLQWKATQKTKLEKLVT